MKQEMMLYLKVSRYNRTCARTAVLEMKLLTECRAWREEAGISVHGTRVRLGVVLLFTLVHIQI